MDLELLGILIGIISLLFGGGFLVFRVKSKSNKVGRDQVINNFNSNITVIGIGNKDDLFSKKSPVLENRFEGADRVIYENGLRLISNNEIHVFTMKEVIEISEFLQELFNKNVISRDAKSYLKGSIFALGTEPINNPEWKEQASSSLRELFHQWGGDPSQLSIAFKKILKNNSNPNEDLIKEEFYKRIHSYYGYFSGKCHHDTNNALAKLQALEKKGMKGADGDEKFFEIVRKFLLEIKKIMDNFYNK